MHDNPPRRFVSIKVIERLLSTKGIKIDHCLSCHHEWEDGYGEPMEFDLGRGRWCMGCCGMSEALDLAAPERGEEMEG